MFLRQHLFRRAGAAGGLLITRRCLSQDVLDYLNKPVQIYRSTSNDPCLNLAVEHYLLQKTAPGSAILFLYVNRPSIIIGRNQNPWLEVNLALLDVSKGAPLTEPPVIGAVDLVRRRSGGGTVFHDEGNVNWTVICPSAIFTRDRHAEMVVKALRDHGISRARVNERHDIVLDQGNRNRNIEFDPNDVYCTEYSVEKQSSGRKPLKVSGSAYKLTKGRALHHGTCLLNSPHLNIIPDYLHSPAKPYISARGVESVSSPVGNILLSNARFMEGVRRRFTKLYECSDSLSEILVEDSWAIDEGIQAGLTELKSPEWTYLQTPQFDLSGTLKGIRINLTARYGAVTRCSLETKGTRHENKESIRENHDLNRALLGQKIHEIQSWESVLQGALTDLDARDKTGVIEWLEKMLPRVSQ